MEERKTEIVHPTLSVALKLHAKILDLMAIVFYHHTSLACDNILYPAFLVFIECAVDETDTPPAAAPRGLHHNPTVIPDGLLHFNDCVCTPRTAGSPVKIQFPQQIHGMLAMREFADAGNVLFRRNGTDATSEQ